MDPISFLATLVGLLSAFNQERQGRTDNSHREFMEWLENHRHEQIREQLAQNHHLSAEVDALLKQDTETILSKLRDIDGVLAQILSRVDGFSGITEQIRPDLAISDQAMHLLRSLHKSDSHQFAIMRDGGGPIAMALHRIGTIDLPEPRYVEDDLQKLVDLRLLRLNRDASGQLWYGLTRAADGYLKIADKS